MISPAGAAPPSPDRGAAARRARHGRRTEPVADTVQRCVERCLPGRLALRLRLVRGLPSTGEPPGPLGRPPSSSRPAADTDHRRARMDGRRSGRREGHAPAASSTASVRAVARVSVCEQHVTREKSANRSRSTTVRPTRCAARIRRITRSTSPASGGVDVGGGARAGCPSGALGAHRGPWAGGPTCTGRRGSRRAGQRVQVSARQPASEQRHRGPARRGRATSADRADAPGRAACGGHPGRHPRSALDRQGVQEFQLAADGTTSSRPAWRPGWRSLQELRAGHPDGDRQPDLVAHLRRRRAAISVGARDASEAADVEERLVDRDALDQRVGPGTPRRPPGSPRYRTSYGETTIAPGTPPAFAAHALRTPRAFAS